LELIRRIIIKHPESLYTPTDVKKVREELIKSQKGIDPILNEPFSEVQVLDHDHTTQHVRAALNRNTNAFEGLVFNAYKRCLKWMTDKPLPEILRGLAVYLEQDYSKNPYHPDWIKRVTIDFNKLKESSKDSVLIELGSPCGKNALERKKNFSKALMTRKFSYNQIMDLIKKFK